MNDKPRTTAEIDPAHVSAYLHAHPNFFLDQEELLLSLRIPHAAGNAVSLIEKQLQILRTRYAHLEQHLAQLTDTARTNDHIFQQTSALVLALLDASSLADVLVLVESRLYSDFQVPFVGLLLFQETPLPVGCSVTWAAACAALGADTLECAQMTGIFSAEQLAFLFGQAQANSIGSAALVLLQTDRRYGLLALGNPDPLHYSKAHGSLFLDYLAAVLARVLARVLVPTNSATAD